MGWLLPILNIILSISAVGVSIAVISIIHSSLWYGSGVWFGGWWATTGTVCYLGNSSANLCSYGYAVAGISMFISFFVFFTQFSKMRPGWTAHSKIEVLIVIFGAIWWLPYAVVTTVYGRRADDAGAPEKNSRTAVWALSWAAFGLFVMQILTSILDYGKHPKPEYPSGTQYGAQGGYVPQQSPPPQYPLQAYGAGPQPPYSYGNAAYQPSQYPPPGDTTVTGYPQAPLGSPPPQAVRAV